MTTNGALEEMHSEARVCKQKHVTFWFTQVNMRLQNQVYIAIPICVECRCIIELAEPDSSTLMYFYVQVVLEPVVQKALEYFVTINQVEKGATDTLSYDNQNNQNS